MIESHARILSLLFCSWLAAACGGKSTGECCSNGAGQGDAGSSMGSIGTGHGGAGHSGEGSTDEGHIGEGTDVGHSGNAVSAVGGGKAGSEQGGTDSSIAGKGGAGKGGEHAIEEEGSAGDGDLELGGAGRSSDAGPLSCTGEGLVYTLPDECMDDGGYTGISDTLEVYCCAGISRFCLSGESCPWRTGCVADSSTCSRGGLASDYLANAWCSEWSGHRDYYCGPDGQIRFEP